MPWRPPADERYLRACASRLPTLAPPDFVTNWVRIGTALLTSSGFSPSFENADAAAASPAADPPSCDSAPDVPTALPAAGAALSSVAMPGTALDTCENSSGFRRDFASEKSAPAAPADCSGVAASSFDSAPTSSGLAFAAAEAAVADCGSPARAVAPATENIANRAAQANAERTVAVMAGSFSSAPGNAPRPRVADLRHTVGWRRRAVRVRRKRPANPPARTGAPCDEHDMCPTDPGASNTGRRRLRLVQPVDDGEEETGGPAAHEDAG